MKDRRIILIGERDPAKVAHRGIEASLARFRQEVDRKLEHVWVSTAAITGESWPTVYRDVSGVWCTPGSPYENTAGALRAIQWARVEKVAFLGTCGGFQHALMEYAANVLQRAAEHEELTPAATAALIVKLSCSLIDAQGRVRVTVPDLFSQVLGTEESTEEFNCNYGLNADRADIFQGTDLEFVAHDEHGQPRAFRLRSHPFFVGTLFQPERKALAGSLHPVVRAFLKAAGN